MYGAYITWANLASQQLSRVVSTAELDRMILTRRYWLLQSMPSYAGSPQVNSLLNAEFDEKVRVIEDAYQALREQIQRWSRIGVFVVADTSF